MEVLEDCNEEAPTGMELLQHLQDDACTTIAEKERRLSEMILQLQLFREQLQGQLLTQQHHPNKVIDLYTLFSYPYIYIIIRKMFPTKPPVGADFGNN